ncbi:MAG: elongation factor Ts [Clostridiales bacterium]|nr:elongation factor Ts [Clostridiales bacterium]
MSFTAKDVQALREKTGVGMMECKKALVEANGDMDKAIDILREKGLAAANKKAGRIAAEGVVLAYRDNDLGVSVLVEVNSETDFVAKNEEFRAFVLDVAKTIAKTNPADVETLLATNLVGSDRTVQEHVQDKVLSIGENIKVRRFVRVEGNTVEYIHGGGTLGVIVVLEADKETAAKEEVIAMGKDVAMQIAAMSPLYLKESDVPADVIEHEKGILMAQIKADEKMANKPEKVIEGIVKGKLSKYFKETCLLEQQFVKDEDITVAQYIESVAKQVGAPVAVSAFYRYAKGEGIQKQEDNFAEEVSSMIK